MSEMRRAALVVVVATCAGCFVDDEPARPTQRFVVAVDVAIPEGVGSWTIDRAGSRNCTHATRDSVTLASVEGPALVETFGSEPIDAATLGASAGEVIDGECTSLLVLDVASADPITLSAQSADGGALGEFSTTPIATELETGLAGRRSPGSPWRLRP